MAQELQKIEYEEFAGNLDRVFEQVRDRDQPVLVERNGELYRLQRDAPDDIWRNYDPKRVDRALRSSAGSLRGIDVDALIAELDAQREQGPNRLL